MNNQHVMVDLETMGNGSHAAILSIGAVKFDPFFPGDEFVKPNDTFHVHVDLESAMKYGRVDASTIKWWLHSKLHAARVNLVDGFDHAIQLDEALIGFADWFGEPKPVWGNGATFDNVILANAYKALGFDVPWTYKHDRCLRTIASLKVPSDKVEPAVAHDALEDAIAQTLWLRKIVKRLGLRLE